MQAENDGDLNGGQRSSEVKWGKLCAMAIIFGRKKNDLVTMETGSFIRDLFKCGKVSQSVKLIQNLFFFF